MKILKCIRMITAFVLILACVAVAPLNIASAETGKYVSEVYLAYGKDADSAKKTLEDKGFTPVDGNLNDGGDTYVMMGYKTTDDIRDSITDLAVMNMRGDYSVEDYKRMLKAQKTEIAEFLTEFMAVIKEYRANLKAGKARATYVHDVLNKYTEDDTGMKMGDLLNSETLQDKVGVMESIEAKNPDKLPDLITILMQGNAQVIKSVEMLLSMATDTADNTWLDRFAELDYDTLLDQVGEERADLNTESKRVQYLDNVYGEDAALLGMEAASLRSRLADYEAMELKIDSATEDDIKNVFGDIENDAEALMSYREWFEVGTIYEGLKNYKGGNYAEGELLSFFLEENDPEDAEIFIPVAAALSEGQRYGLPFVRFEQVLSYAFATEESWKDFVDNNSFNFDEFEEVSVYQNIDRDLYKDDGSVALTSAAQRAENTAEGTTGDENEQKATLSEITKLSWVATAALGLTAAATWSDINKVILSKDVFKDGVNRQLVYASDEIWGAVKAQNTLTPDSIRTINSARLAVKMARFISVMTLALAVISTVLTIIDLCRVNEIEQLPIPKYLVDNYTDEDGGSYSLNYKAVECNREEYFGADYKRQKGSSADLNADEGKQWLVLFASKNSKAGKPLTPDFVVQKSNQAPSGYEGNVHLFREKGAVNVVSGAFKNYSSLSRTWQNITGDYTMYIFSKLSNDVKTYDESAGNMTATAMNSGMIAIWGFGGLALGAVLGIVGTVLVNKNKRKKETE